LEGLCVYVYIWVYSLKGIVLNMKTKFSKNKLLHIITLGELGGAQTHLLDLCNYQKDAFEVGVVMGTIGPLWDELKDRGIPVYKCSSLQRSLSPVLDFKAFIELNSIVKELTPDLVCTHSSKAGFLGRFVAYKNGIPAVFTAHGWSFTDGVSPVNRKIYLQLERMAAKWCEGIICVSEYDRQLALEKRVASSNKLVTIHNGIPTSGCSATSTCERAPIRIIMVARFSEQKDQQLLVRAASQLKTMTDFEIDFVGDGPLLSATEELARKLQISDKVRFLGARTDVSELLEKAHIFVLTSNWEGFPITILEAMRAGLPVITSDVGGCKEAVIDGITGYLIPRGDLECLKERLGRLLNDSQLRTSMGDTGFDRFSKYFTVEQMAEKTMAVYESIISDL